MSNKLNLRYVDECLLARLLENRMAPEIFQLATKYSFSFSYLQEYARRAMQQLYPNTEAKIVSSVNSREIRAFNLQTKNSVLHKISFCAFIRR